MLHLQVSKRLHANPAHLVHVHTHNNARYRSVRARYGPLMHGTRSRGQYARERVGGGVATPRQTRSTTHMEVVRKHPTLCLRI